MSTASEHAGRAALSICEALLLAMNDLGLLSEHEIVGVLRDAAATQVKTKRMLHVYSCRSVPGQ